MANNSIALPTASPYPGVSLVSDINRAFQSVATDFAGPVDPAANAGAYMRWVDTANGLIKRRNAANSAWLIEGTLFVRPIQTLTFAEIDALASDVGPIHCADMPGSPFYTWVNTAYFTGYRSGRCGEMPNLFVDTPRAWELLMTGGVWNINDPKQKRVIAFLREQGKVCPAANWIKGQGMISDLGGGDWKAPDEQDMFMRKAGTDADTANAAPVGTYAGHELANHFHLYTAPYGSAVTPTTTSNTTAWNTGTTPTNSSSTTGTGGAETRPVNTRVAPIILI